MRHTGNRIGDLAFLFDVRSFIRPATSTVNDTLARIIDHACETSEQPAAEFDE